jgi:hypothetical protein
MRRSFLLWAILWACVADSKTEVAKQRAAKRSRLSPLWNEMELTTFSTNDPVSTCSYSYYIWWLSLLTIARSLASHRTLGMDSLPPSSLSRLHGRRVGI